MIKDQLNIPVAIFNGAHGGQPISFFDRPSDYTSSTNSNYGRLYHRLNKTGLRNYVRTILWSQGEADSFANGLTTSQYITAYENLMSYWQEDYPGLEKYYIFQTRDCNCGTISSGRKKIKEAQRRLALENNNVNIMPTTGMQVHSDYCHYPFVNGYEKFALRIFPQVMKDIYGLTLQESIYAPMASDITLSGNILEIQTNSESLVSNNSNTTALINSLNNDFVFSDSSISIVNFQLDLSKLILTLNQNPSNNTTLSFIGLSSNLEDNITNSSGIEPPEILNLSDENPFHTNFKISTDSETLTLSNNIGTVVDQMIVEGLPPNTSVGISNVTENLVSYLQTTPGYQNDDQEFLGTIQNEVIFSQNGGILQNPFNLSLSGNTPTQHIRYTTDGSAPKLSSTEYTSPIAISQNKSVRAGIFSNTNNYLPSKVSTESYVLGANHNMDVMLLTVDPEDFFDDDTGIYVFGPEGTFDTWQPYFGANFWEDWERPIQFSFYKNNSNEFAKFNAGVKIFGGWSRGQNGQRSLAIYARGQYGDSKFEHSFFDNLSYNKFEAFVLRSSGQDWLRSNMKDIMLTSLMRGSGLDFQEHNPVATYINGEYWGFYNLREKTNEHMLASKHGVDAENITLLTNNAEIIEGDNDEYNALIDYIETTDLSNDSNFEYVSERIDLKHYALYQATNIFINNTDWPGNNIKFWKHPDTKWRWIMYDTDFGFGPWWNWGNFNENTLEFSLNPNGPDWPNPAWSTLLFRKLITNISFRNQFINRYADELNTRFLSSNVIQHINEIYGTIQPEINAHFERWKDDPSVGYEITDVNGHIGFYQWALRNFASERPPIVKEHIKNQFNLPNFHPITITNEDISKGKVEINENLNIQELSWTGDYFETVPIKLEAIAEAGYEFSHWSGDLYSTQKTINIYLSGSFEVIPNFSSIPTSLVINEINYRSSDDFNPDDWIELYNPMTFAVDVSNWQIKDSDDTHVFVIPEGTQIQDNGFLIVVKDESDFMSLFPDTPYIGELGFGLGKTDSVRLYNSEGTLIDEVAYESELPWPNCADKTGNTLELKTPDLDNELAENWDCINENGSPNAINSDGLTNSDKNRDIIKIYPNPVKEKLYISGNSSIYSVEILSLLGQNLIKVNNTNMVDLSVLNKGIYLIKIENKGITSTFKIIKQ